jgi:hypothetical protein
MATRKPNGAKAMIIDIYERINNQARDILLLFAEESEVLTHPYLLAAHRKRSGLPALPAPGASILEGHTIRWNDRESSRTERYPGLGTRINGI